MRKFLALLMVAALALTMALAVVGCTQRTSTDTTTTTPETTTPETTMPPDTMMTVPDTAMSGGGH